MKYLLPLLLMLTLQAHAASLTMTAALQGTNSAPGGGGSYFLEENFEGSNSGYDLTDWNTWYGSTIDPDYTGVVLEGTQSMRLNNSGVRKIIDEANVYFRFQFRILSGPGSNQRDILQLGDGKLDVALNTSSQLVIVSTGASATTVGALSSGVTYYIWGGYTKGTGANQTAYIAFSTSNSKPISGDNYTSFSNGGETLNINRVAFLTDSAGVAADAVYDELKLSTTDIP